MRMGCLQVGKDFLQDGNGLQNLIATVCEDGLEVGLLVRIQIRGAELTFQFRVFFVLD
jgi:hypothetical protein